MTSADCGMKKKTRAGSIFSFSCGCRSNGAVSIAADLPGVTRAPLSSRRLRPETSSEDTTTRTTGTTSTSRDDDNEDDGDTTASSPSFSGLLHQLGELERSVVSMISSSACGEVEEKEEEERKYPAVAASAYGFCHRRSISDGGSGGANAAGGKVGGFVAVVKQTEDPLGDFRRSMLQMIVEKEILSGEELRDLLCRFLSLNSPAHHALIVQAFADIWRDVFSGHGGEDLLLPGYLNRRRQLRRDFHYQQRGTR